VLTQSDVEFIKLNRSELTANRTEPITLLRASTSDFDPYTGEPTTTESTEVVNVVWKEVSTIANGERDVVNGVELQNNDVQVTFDASVDLTDVLRIERAGLRHTIVTIDEKGIGAINRSECIVRRTT
jgi:hypothetical protein